MTKMIIHRKKVAGKEKKKKDFETKYPSNICILIRWYGVSCNRGVVFYNAYNANAYMYTAVLCVLTVTGSPGNGRGIINIHK